MLSATPYRFEPLWNWGGLGQQVYNPATTASGITKTVTGTVGASLLAAAPFSGPGAPFVAAAGALLELDQLRIRALLGLWGDLC